MATATAIDREEPNVPGGPPLPGAVAPRDGRVPGTDPQRFGAGDYGPNNERLEDQKPKLVAALRDLVLQFRQEGIVARRHEIRRIRQARLFWQGLQYAWWNPQDMQW
ncbi:MAG TPA: hypothetical protein VHM88_23300, partial [Candidatus Acidoferrales bacterium]|nr:hypothetical protein [Candidatus Acidoferrales bacterium]